MKIKLNPLEHRLLFEFAADGLDAAIAKPCLGQRFVAQGAATFFWSVLPARMEWRYDQQALDALLRLDGEEEYVLYMAPVGKKAG